MSNKAFNTISGLGPNTRIENNRENNQSNNRQNNRQNNQSNFQSNLNKYKNEFDPTNPNIRGDQIRVSEYEVLNTYDHNTLDRMSSNIVDFNSPNANPEYPTRQVPPFSNFVSPREPSLDVGMRPLPIQNPTILPNQLHRSLDLLAQTDQLAISTMHKNSNFLDNSSIINTNELDKTLDKFQGVAVPHIPYETYDKPSSLFNNFVGEGRNDIIREYICHINSIDRDIKQFPNPFNFLVKCAPLAGDTNAAISRTFQNIRYIKIETAVLPRQYFVTKTKITNHPDIVSLFSLFGSNSNNLPADNSIINITIPVPSSIITTNKFVIIHAYSDSSGSKQYINYTDFVPDFSESIMVSYEAIKDIYSGEVITYQYDLSCLSIENDKYTILYLNDINDVSQFSTDQTLSTAFNVLYPDEIVGNYIYVDCRYADKIYKFSDLGNLTKLQLRLSNSLGKPLTTNIKAYDYNIPTISSNTCTCQSNPDTGNIDRDFRCLCNYIRHPRYIKNQVDLMFKLGIVETDFDKRAFN